MSACSLVEAIKSGNNHQAREGVLRKKSAQPVTAATFFLNYTQRQVNRERIERLTRGSAVQTNLRRLNRKVYEISVCLSNSTCHYYLSALVQGDVTPKCYKGEQFSSRGHKNNADGSAFREYFLCA